MTVWSEIMPIVRLHLGWLGLVVLFTLSLESRSSHAQGSEQLQSDHLLKVDLLFVGAHPDDESGVTATFAREVLDHGAKAAVILVTRGEGGGNGIGRELGPSLGLLREAELRRSTGTYGVDLVYFLDKTDFFYTLSSQAAFNVWNHDDTLGRLVRLVRLLRPEVMVTMWPGPGTHGMHQAAARLATEAFTAAGDSNRFPEQITEEFLRPWHPLKLYYNTDQPGSLAIRSDGISPSRFMSYAEIKAMALRNYRSQGFDRFATLPPRRSNPESFLLVKPRVQTSTHPDCLLEGVHNSSPSKDQRTQNGSRPDGSTRLPGQAPPVAPLSVSIVPRADIVEFRQWGERHQVAWAAGMLPASVSIGTGQTDTVWVTVSNHQNKVMVGQITLTLPAAWNRPPVTTSFTNAAGKSVSIACLVTVPSSVAQGSYPMRVDAVSGAAAATDTGHIDVLPVMRLPRTSRKIAIDGRLDDWQGVPEQAIPATSRWSGSVFSDTDCSGTVRASYDADYLYIAVAVNDNAVVLNIAPDDIKGHWRTDSVEICVDPSGRSENTLTVFKTGIFPGTTAGPQAAAERDADGQPGPIGRTAPGMLVTSSFRDGGYVIETAIPWRDLPGGQTPVPGQTLGVNVIIYDGDDTGAGIGANIEKSRLAWSFWPSAQALPYYYGRVIVE